MIYLHASVVDDHVLELDVGVQLRDFGAASKEKTVSEFHDVGFMDGGDLLAVVFRRVIESELRDTTRFLLSHNLQAFDHTFDTLKRRTFEPELHGVATPVR